MNIAFPAVMNTFGVSTKTVQWLTTGNLLVVAMITPLSAFLQRRFKLKNLFVFGTMCFVVGTVVAIFSPNFAFFLINAIMLGNSFLLPNYLQVALLCESMAAGFMLLPGAGLNALMGPFSGAALDKIGAKLPILTGTGLMTIGVWLLTVFGMKLNTGMIVGSYVIFGIGWGIAFGNTMTIGNLRLPVEQKAYGNTSFNFRRIR